MCRLIESICLTDNKLRNLELHQERIDRSQKELFGKTAGINLEQSLKKAALPESGKYKIRVLYSRHLESIEVIPYRARKIKSFMIVENDTISYPLKFEDRTVFSKMKESVAEDEIIIVKNGAVTDTSFSNLIFFDGSKWVTPVTYLLNGTMRQFLLSKRVIASQKIRFNDLKRFQSFKLINALLAIDESETYDMSLIKSKI